MKQTVLLFFLLFSIVVANAQQITDQPFKQEYQEAFPFDKLHGEHNVRSIATDRELNVWVATAAGVFKKKSNDSLWQSVFDHDEQGPAFALLSEQGRIWIATWKAVFVWENNSLQLVAGIAGPVSVLCNSAEGVYAVGPNGIWLFNGKVFEKKTWSVARSVRTATSDQQGGIWIGTDVGLYHCTEKSTSYFQGEQVLLSASIKGVALDSRQRIWAAGLGGVSILNRNKKEKTITPGQGCPSVYVNCIRQSPDGSMWIGTQVGIVRYYKDGSHSLLFTRRWLLSDQVNDISFDREGTAWIATANGVSAIKKRISPFFKNRIISMRS